MPLRLLRRPRRRSVTHGHEMPDRQWLAVICPPDELGVGVVHRGQVMRVGCGLERAELGCLAHQGIAAWPGVRSCRFDVEAAGPCALARFEASVLVVGGSMAGSWDLVRPPLLGALLRAEPALAGLAVRRAAHPEDSALIGPRSTLGRLTRPMRREASAPEVSSPVTRTDPAYHRSAASNSPQRLIGRK
jgi:hypothetical protein